MIECRVGGGVYMRRRRSRYKIGTAEEFETSILEYLDAVDEANKDRFVVYDLLTGAEYATREDAEKAGVKDHHIKAEFEKVPVYDMVKPTLSGYAAFMGMSLPTYYATERRTPEMTEIGEWFRTLLESEVEQLLLNPMNRNSSGAKMVAINRHKWSDKVDHDISGTDGGGITIDFNIPSKFAGEKDESSD